MPMEPASGGKGGGGLLKLARCGTCPGCLVTDCGKCKNCLDKPKYGGPGVKKQACVGRKCMRLRPAHIEEEERRGATEGSADEAPSSAGHAPASVHARAGVPAAADEQGPVCAEPEQAGLTAPKPHEDARRRQDDVHADSASTTTSTHGTPAGAVGRTTSLLRHGETATMLPLLPSAACAPAAGDSQAGGRHDGSATIEPSSLAILSFVTAQAAAAAAAADAAKMAAAAAADACNYAHTSVIGAADLPAAAAASAAAQPHVAVAGMFPMAPTVAQTPRPNGSEHVARAVHTPLAAGGGAMGPVAPMSTGGRRRGSHSQDAHAHDEDALVAQQRSPHRRNVHAGDRSPHNGGSPEEAPPAPSAAPLFSSPPLCAVGAHKGALPIAAVDSMLVDDSDGDGDGADGGRGCEDDQRHEPSPSHAPPRAEWRKHPAYRGAPAVRVAGGTGGGRGRRVLPGAPSAGSAVAVASVDVEYLQRLARRPFKLDKERRRAGSSPGYYAALLSRGGTRAPKSATEPPHASSGGGRGRKRPRGAYGADLARVSPLERGLGVLYDRLHLQLPPQLPSSGGAGEVDAQTATAVLRGPPPRSQAVD